MTVAAWVRGTWSFFSFLLLVEAFGLGGEPNRLVASVTGFQSSKIIKIEI
jgi:hypothetical protein